MNAPDAGSRLPLRDISRTTGVTLTNLLRPRLLCTAVLLASWAQPGQGQVVGAELPVVVDDAQRAEAVVAALRFPSPLLSDTIAVAACRLTGILGAEAYARILAPAFGSRLTPIPSRAGEQPECAVSRFREAGSTTIFLERIVETRSRSHGIAPGVEQLRLEVGFQLIRGRNGREWHEVTLRPVMGLHGGARRVERWQVVDYAITASSSH